MYIGYTAMNMEERWAFHVRDAHKGSDLAFHVAIREFEPMTWEHVVICDGVETLKNAQYLERHYIEMLGTWGAGYNMTRGGNGSGPKSVESRNKMRLARLGKKLSSQHRQNIGKSLEGKPSGMCGKHHTDESKSKTSLALKGKKKPPFTDEHRANIAAVKRGTVPWNKRVSEESL